MTNDELQQAGVAQAACAMQVVPIKVRAGVSLSAFQVRHSSRVIRHTRRSRAFSMAELMIAVVILGVGLLITSSMFPIAWFKAREVAESAVVPALADAAEVAVELNCRASRGHDNVGDLYVSSFFPGDWFAKVPGTTETAAVYPDTRVHHLNTGNYLANTSEDYWDDSGISVPVGDDSWELEDNLDSLLDGSLQAQAFMQYSQIARQPQLRAHTRLSLPLEARPLSPPLVTVIPDSLAVSHWEERFELRRHSWAVFYKFSQLPGLEYGIENIGDINGDGNVDGADSDLKQELANQRLKRPRQLTLYYVTLKRPVNARYARQQRYDLRSSNPEVIDPLDPQPHPDNGDADYRLPTPWRFSARLLTLPVDSVPGVQSEIVVPSDIAISDVLVDGVVLIDDRTGQVFTITDRREGTVEGVNSIVLSLDGFYRVIGGQFAPDYDPVEAGLREQWERESKWIQAGCDQAVARVIADEGLIPNDILPVECRSRSNNTLFLGEDDPGLRTYWFFPPPVDRSPGAPTNPPPFDGSPPVVGVEVRQLTL